MINKEPSDGESQFFNEQTQQKISHLLRAIKKTLDQPKKLSPQVQKELASLLHLISLTNKPEVIRNNSDLLEIIDLTIFVLIGNPDDCEEPEINVCEENLHFVRSIRQKIAAQVSDYPNPVRALFTASGSAYHRLISGLTYFVLIFVISPLVYIFAILPIFSLGNQYLTSFFSGIALEDYEVAINLLIAEQEQLKKTVAQQKAQNKILEGQLQLSTDSIQKVLNSDNLSQDSLIYKDLENIVNGTNQVISSLQETQVNQDTISPVIEPSLAPLRLDDTIAGGTVNDNNTEEVTPRPSLSPSEIPQEQIQTQQRQQAQKAAQQAKEQVGLVTSEDRQLMIWVVITGGLGSAISVIVRANDFITQAKDKQIDLFFTGFFRPVVGMTFAVFVVAVIESGILSGFFSITDNQIQGGRKSIYPYLVLSFAAGFSERLVKDLIGQAESKFNK